MKSMIYICSRFPYPLEKGDKLRAYHQLKSLSQQINIHLICFSENKILSEDLSIIKKIVKQVYIFKVGIRLPFNVVKRFFSSKPLQLAFFDHPSVHKQIKSLIKTENIDFCFTQLIRVASYTENLNIPKVLDYMDVLSVGVQRQSEHKKGITSWLYKLESNRLKNYENHLQRKYNKTYIITDQDKNFLPVPSPETVEILVNGVDEAFFEKLNLNKEFDLCFAGNMSYPPNVLAAKTLIHDILPELLKKKPKLKVLIAGASPSQEIINLASENVTISGWMDDIREAYASSRLFVAPLFIGTGLQNKLLEAMALGTPCITTTLCNNALKAKKDQEIYIADNISEYVESIHFLLDSKNAQDILIQNARSFVQKNYNWTKLGNSLSEDLLSLT